MLVREAICFTHLAQDLRFSQQHGIKSRRYPEEMPHRLAIIVMIERYAEDFRPHGVELTQVGRQSRSTFMGRLRRHSIHFAAIAGGEYQCLFEDSPRAKLFRSTLSLFGGKRHSLPHLNGCRAMIQSDENDFHAAVQSLLKVAVTMRQIQIHNRKTQHHNDKIEDAQLGCPRAAPRCCARQTEINHV